MEGQFDDPEQRGIIPRSVHLIFQQLEDKKVDFSVKVSYLEIYNEELGDLLDDSYNESSTSDKRKSVASSSSTKHKKLLLCDGEKGVVCNNLTEVNCYSAKEVFELLRKGIDARQVAETQMNKASSRSHSIVTLKIMIKETTVNGEQVRFGQLNLVDLAGSECVQRSGATGERLREAGNINQSLLTLGRVITGLSERKSGFIPYRDSKLTRLLQESLGGRAKTCIVATVSPADDSVDESGSTLEYAHRARSIKNKPVTNSTSSKNSVLREYTQEVEEMRKILQAQREKSGTYLPTEKYEEMVQALETGRANLDLCEEELGRLREQVSTEKLRADGLSSDLAFSKKQCAETEAELNLTKDVLQKTEIDLEATRVTLHGTQAIVGEQTVTESELTEQAKVLDNSLAESTNDISGLLAKVQRASVDAESKADATSKLGQDTLAVTSFLRQKCSDLTSAISTNGTDVKTLLVAASKSNSKMFEHIASTSASYDNRLSTMSQDYLVDSNRHTGSIQTEMASYGETTKKTMSDINSSSSTINTCVNASVATVLEVIQNQHGVIEMLSKHIEDAARAAEEKMHDFVQLNASAIANAQTAHKAQVEQQLAVISSMKQTIQDFKASQLSSLQKLESGGVLRRQEAHSMQEEALQAEEAAAALRAASIEKEARERNHALEKDAEELLTNFTTAINAFKRRHIEACTTGASSTACKVKEEASAHTQRMSTMLSQIAQHSQEAEKDSCMTLGQDVTSFTNSVNTSMSSVTGLNSASSAQMYESMDSAVTQFKSFSATTCDGSKEMVAAAKDSIEQVAAFGNSVSKECGSMQEQVQKTNSGLVATVENFEAISSTTARGISLHSETMLQANNQFSTSISALCDERSTCLREQLSTGINKLESTQASITNANSVLEEVSIGHMTAHNNALVDFETSMSAHVTLSVEPLKSTGNTPEKRKFDRPDEFTQTRPHELIMKDAKSKRVKHSSVEEKLTASTPIKREASNENNENSTKKSSARSSQKNSISEVVKNPLMEATNLVE